MAKLVVVENDTVEGTDKHHVSGDATNPAPPPPTVPGAWVADFDYVGKMTDALSDFVHVDDRPVALVSSRSSLDPGEDVPPSGRHSGPMAGNFVPTVPAPVTPSLGIDDPIGTGNPNAAAGSTFVSVDGDAVLLDGDAIDTCDGLGVPANSTVTAENQDFVSCSE
jgi:hypothetical protein